MRLAGKVAVITGAGSGIGRAMAELFAAEGAKVVAGEWNETTLNELVTELRAKGSEATGVKVNIAVKEEAEGLIDKAVAAYGKVDVLCNNAGVMDMFAGVGELPDEMWRRVLSINLDGPMYITRRVIPLMRKQGSGSIINTTSMAGLGGGSAGVAYTVSKHGVVGLTKSTAFMYAKEGIRCNAIAPGGVETGIQNSMVGQPDEFGYNRCVTYHALAPTFLKPIDIAELALFLASDASRNINGAIIPADAGWRAA